MEINLLNPFSINVLHLYPFKTAENRRFIEGYRSETLVESGLTIFCQCSRTFQYFPGFCTDC